MVSGWSDRKHTVQDSGTSAESYTVTVLQEWGKEYVGEEVEHRKSGEYLVTRPTSRDLGLTKSKLSFENSLRDKTRDELETYLENIIQSYCIAGVDEVTLIYPDAWGDEFIQKVEKIIQKIGRATGIKYNREAKTIEFNQVVDFDEFANRVANFAGMYISDFFEGQSSEPPSGMLHDEAIIDLHWAFAARSAGESYLELEREKFPQEMCSLYIAKYLEEVVDEVKKIGLKLDRLDENPAELQEILSKLYGIYQGEILAEEDLEIPAYDSQIRQISKRGRDLDQDADDFAEQYRILMVRRDTLEAWREIARNKLSERSPDISSFEAGMIIGELWRISERLFRIPVSMTLVGVGARRVGLVHDIDD